MAHIRFSRDTDEVACGKSIRMRFSRGESFLVGCMRTNKHPGKCIAMAYDAAKADGVCYGCRAAVMDEHRLFDKKRRLKCPAMDCLVECSFCCQRFGRAFNLVSYTQGADCASWIDGERLLCGYGSAYDFEAFEFLKGAPVGFENANPVCDGCVRGFIEQGALKTVEGV
jgi:hypothetical protein